MTKTTSYTNILTFYMMDFRALTQHENMLTE